MKRLALSIMLLFSAIGNPGCSQNTQTVAYQSAASIQTAVKASLDAWSEYVVIQRKANDLLPEGAAKSNAIAGLAANEQKVRIALIRYQQSAALAKIAVSTTTGSYGKDAVIKAGNDFIKTVSLIIQ